MSKRRFIEISSRYCRNLFRSIINFVTHKRSYCRGRFESITAQTALSEFATNALSSGSVSNGSNSNEDRNKNEHQPKRTKGILKRTNIIGALNKRIEHYALTLPDSNVIETMPHAIATKESLPQERVPLVIPQDYSYRYREMNLRYRRNDPTKHDVIREVGSNEIAVMDALCKYVVSIIDLASMSCLHSDCKDKRPFSSVFTLAYHVTVKHNRRWLPDRRIPCFLCSAGFATYDLLMVHLKEEHYHYHIEHCTARAKQEEERSEPKRGRKPKLAHKVSSNGRSRSLSPMSEDFVETDESMGEESDREHEHEEELEEDMTEHVDEREADGENGRDSEVSSNGRSRSLSPMSEDFVETDESMGEESDREHEHEEELEEDMTEHVGEREADGENGRDSETSSPPQSLSSVNMDLDAASPEWGVDPPHLTPEMENHTDDHDDFEAQTAVIRETVDYLVSTVVDGGDGAGDGETGRCTVEVKEEENASNSTTMTTVVREVSAVEACELREDGRYFRIRWKGINKRTWELDENLKNDHNAMKLIAKFLKARNPKQIRWKGINKRTWELDENLKNDHNAMKLIAKFLKARNPKQSAKLESKVAQEVVSKEDREPHITSSPGPSKEVKEGFEKSHAEKNVPKRRGRKQRLTDKSVSKSPEDTRDDASGHSDDVGDICVVFDIGDDSADEVPKRRPSRHRRKPNWIDDVNFVTAFKKKRPRQNTSNEVEVNAEEVIDGVSASSLNTSSLETSAKLKTSEVGEDGNCDPTCLPPVSSLSEPVDIAPLTTFPEASILSNEGSLSRQPSPDLVLPPDEKPLLIVEKGKERLYKSVSPRARSNSPGSIGPHSVASDPGVVLPASFVTPVRRYGSECSPIVITPKSARKDKELVDSRFSYTPRARKLKFGEEDLRPEYYEEHDENTASSSSTGPSHSRRKQNLSKINENDNITIVRLANGRAPPRPEDLSEVPVYLTEVQRDLFFSFIRPASTSTEGAQKCMQCGKIVANMMEGRRHAVGHLRIMRLRCSLCDSGSFFCSDMRTHLQYRHCPKLYLAPRGYVQPGDMVPCMTRRQADELTKLVDPQKPGRVMYTSGKIVSSTNPVPYYPDPEIEKRVLGSLQPATADVVPQTGHSDSASRDGHN
uniref:Chromo domain-containing protein n=1 Tax=Ascaris lumbricoides TaxID=6252 RepID=A0A9J2Q3I5_ASCLU